MRTSDDYGYVYIMHIMDNTENKLYKIGHCSKNKSRLGEYTLLPYEVEYTILAESNNRRHIEECLHNMFYKNRVRGEWFKLSEHDIDIIRKFLVGKGCSICKEPENSKKSRDQACDCKKIGTIIPVYAGDYSDIAEGSEEIYMIKFLYGVMKEQYLGKVLFYHDNHGKKIYPNLNLDETQMRDYVMFDSRYKHEFGDFSFRASGTNRRDSYGKMTNLCFKRIKHEEEQIAKCNKRISDYKKIINMCQEQLDEEED